MNDGIKLSVLFIRWQKKKCLVLFCFQKELLAQNWYDVLELEKNNNLLGTSICK